MATGEVAVAQTPPDLPGTELCLTPRNRNTNGMLEFMAENFYLYEFFFYKVGMNPPKCMVDIVKTGLYILDIYVQHTLDSFLSHYPQSRPLFFGQNAVFRQETGESVRYLRILRFTTQHPNCAPEVVDVMDNAEYSFLVDSGVIASYPNSNLTTLVAWLRHEASTFLGGLEVEQRNISAHLFNDLLRKPYHTRMGPLVAELNPDLATRGCLTDDLGMRFFTLRVLEGMIQRGRLECHFTLLFDAASAMLKNYIKSWIPTSCILHADGFPPLYLESGNGGALQHVQLLRPAVPAGQIVAPDYFGPLPGLPWERY